MIEVGNILEIGGRQATVCYETTLNNTNYICVAFGEEKIQYEIYKYKTEGEKLLVAKVEDKNELLEVTKIFLKDGIDEFGIPKELEPILDALEKNSDKLEQGEKE